MKFQTYNKSIQAGCSTSSLSPNLSCFMSCRQEVTKWNALLTKVNRLRHHSDSIKIHMRSFKEKHPFPVSEASSRSKASASTCWSGTTRVTTYDLSVSVSPRSFYVHFNDSLSHTHNRCIGCHWEVCSCTWNVYGFFTDAQFTVMKLSVNSLGCFPLLWKSLVIYHKYPLCMKYF